MMTVTFLYHRVVIYFDLRSSKVTAVGQGGLSRAGPEPRCPPGVLRHRRATPWLTTAPNAFSVVGSCHMGLDGKRQEQSIMAESLSITF